MTLDISKYDIRLVVTGGRDYEDRGKIFPALEEAMGGPEFPGHQLRVFLAQGGCRTGADALVRTWVAEEFYEGACPHVILTSKTYYAEWDRHGRAAGPIRNKIMIDDVQPTLVLAFPGGRGTADCVREAHAKGYPVQVIL